ncbi:MAG: selenide, water dikinase SelD [Acidobacteriota bacterium]
MSSTGNTTFRLSKAAKAGGCAAKIGLADLRALVQPLIGMGLEPRHGGSVLVGAETGDDAGVYLIDGLALIATADFIPPLCDDPRRFGRIAAANALSDVWAMGGEPLFALNLCCFPTGDVPEEVLSGILTGGAEALREAGAVLLGGHSIRDPELKFGMAVIGRGNVDTLFTNAGALPGERLILTKPLGSGVLVNAFKFDKIDAEGLEPALREMERLNGPASRLALTHGVRAATDITGFGLVGHAMNIARNSNLRLRIAFDALPVHPGFGVLVAQGVTTGCTRGNRSSIETWLRMPSSMSTVDAELLFDPQTSGGLLFSVPAARGVDLLAALRASGHLAAEIGETLTGEASVEIV